LHSDNLVELQGDSNAADVPSKANLKVSFWYINRALIRSEPLIEF